MGSCRQQPDAREEARLGDEKGVGLYAAFAFLRRALAAGLPLRTWGIPAPLSICALGLSQNYGTAAIELAGVRRATIATGRVIGKTYPVTQRVEAGVDLVQRHVVVLIDPRASAEVPPMPESVLEIERAEDEARRRNS